MHAIAAAAIKRISDVKQRELGMLLSATSQLDSLVLSWTLLKHAESSRLYADGLGLSALLMECEQRGQWRNAVLMVLRLARRGGVSTAASNVAAMWLARFGDAERALSLLRKAGQTSGLDRVSGCVWSACGGGVFPHDLCMPSPLPKYQPAHHEKEVRLLEYVLRTASVGDAGSVCRAIEDFGQDVLNPENQWLKVAGGKKAEVLSRVSDQSVPRWGEVLEIGTYCGYSAIHIARTLPYGARITSIEVNPTSMIVARSLVAFAGLAHVIDVVTGHSKGVLPRMANARPGRHFSMVFMDQSGSRYDADLAVLEGSGLIGPGSVVIADNALKPGAPLLLWHLLKSGFYATEIISLAEFAMPSEDWMVVAKVLHCGEKASSPPKAVLNLQREADRMRARASQPGAGGVTFEEWSEFSARMREALLNIGIGEGIPNESGWMKGP